MRRSGGSFKKSLTIASYVAAGAIAAFWTAYWPASAGNTLTKLDIASTQLTPVSDSFDRPNKTDRLPGVSFEERWNAMPSSQVPTRDRKSQHEPPQAGGLIENIPFSCELAFSRLVTKGNFSTRCLASMDTMTKLAAAE
jgi:hypothetical protein